MWTCAATSGSWQNAVSSRVQGEVTTGFPPEITHDLSVMEIRINGNPALSAQFTEIEVKGARTERLTGEMRYVLAALFGLVKSLDPDVILIPDADTWMPKIRTLAQQYQCSMPFSRNGKYRQMDSHLVLEFGRMEHENRPSYPDGRILIDTEQSFVFREGGLRECSWPRGSPDSLRISRPGSPPGHSGGYEVCEAVKQGIAVPFGKSNPEQVTEVSALQATDGAG